MHESDTYYEEILYPLQNGVLSTLAASRAPFYLTGGTALHRHYFGFRYSDDLDLFVNQDAGFDGHVDRALAALRERGYRFDGDAFLRTDQYARVLISLSVSDESVSDGRCGRSPSWLSRQSQVLGNLCEQIIYTLHCHAVPRLVSSETSNKLTRYAGVAREMLH